MRFQYLITSFELVCTGYKIKLTKILTNILEKICFSILLLKFKFKNKLSNIIKENVLKINFV
jgi:hypothetical protein